MAVEEIHPQTFDDGAWTWTDPAKTYNDNVSDYGYFNEQITEAEGVLAVWSNFEGKGDWQDDGDMTQKITTIGLSVVSIGLRYSDLDSPSWSNPAHYHVLKALSTDNVTEQTYSVDVPVGFDWTKAKLAAVYEKAGEPETPTLRVFDSWGEGLVEAREDVLVTVGPGIILGETYSPQLEAALVVAGGQALVSDYVAEPREDVGETVGVKIIVVDGLDVEHLIATLGVETILADTYPLHVERLGQVIGPQVLVGDILELVGEDVLATVGATVLVTDSLGLTPEHLVVIAAPKVLVGDWQTYTQDVLVTLGLETAVVDVLGFLVYLLAARLVSFSNPSEDVRSILANGRLVDRTRGTRYPFGEAGAVRAYLRVVRGELSVEELAVLPTPMDMVKLSWAPVGGERYNVYRDAALVVGELNGDQYLDGPLDDGTYDYKLRATDPEGDFTDSTVEQVTVATVPDPPTNLSYTWTSGTKTLTLSWTASPSSDVAHYHVYSSGGDEELLLAASSILKTESGLSTDIAFTNETGTYIFLIRADDTSGREEENIDQVLVLPFQSGALALPPAEPQYVRAEAVADGKIKLTWTYYQAEIVAVEARIYYDNGSGEVSYATPLDTVAMGASGDTYTWTSGVLTDEQEYLFTVRAATGIHPAGVETTNVDVHAATADSDVPAQPVLTAEVV